MQGRPEGSSPARQVRRQRLDHAHKTALALVRDYDVIVHEDLKITDMTRAATAAPGRHGGFQPNGTAAKAGLNKSIYDAGWGTSCASFTPRLKAPDGT